MKGDVGLRLSSLELQGFKSFPDKTYLDFDDGITAVVGPNGSGKSNIADAVRWVLGEQSTKTLRGGKMEDVIFNGTKERKPVGYASVKLTIEDVSTELPEDRLTTISRRLYRSGESEYRINGSIVRLKDIHELFMDTGLGRDGYSIIGQGKIADIVSAKSAQRREIFEEAAGISKYRYRRAEAERRLASAEENLVRLRDILGELEDRVGPLKAQSEKAKKYLVLAEERKNLEISLWVEELEILNKEMSAHNDKILVAKNDYDHLESQSAKLEQDISDAFENMQRMSVAVDERRNSIKNLEDELSGGDARSAVYENDIQHNCSTLERIARQQEGKSQSEEELGQLMRSSETRLKELSAKLAELKVKIDSAKNALITDLEESQKLSDKLEGLRARKSTLETGLSEIRMKDAASRSIIDESSIRLEELSRRDDEYDKAVEESRLNLEECSKQIARQQDYINSLNNTKSGYQIKKQLKEKTHVQLEEKQKKLGGEIDTTLSRARILKDMEANMEGYAGSVRYILDQSRKGNLGGIFGAVSSLISVEPEYITAVETALGGSGQHVVVEDENSAKRAIEMLKKGNAGRGTFLPLTSVKGSVMDFSRLKKYEGFVGGAYDLVKYNPKFKGIINQVLGRVCVVDNLTTGTLIAKEAGYRFRIVTLDGQVINAGGSYTGGTVMRSGGVLGRKNEIEALEAKASKLENELKEFQPELQKSKEELAAIEATITGTIAEIQSGQEELVRLGFAKEQLENSLQTAETNRNLAKAELGKIRLKLKELEEGKTTSQQLIADNAAEINLLDNEIKAALDRQEALNSESETSREEVSALQIEELGLNRDIAAIKEEQARIKNQIESSGRESLELQEEKARLEKTNLEIQGKISELKERREVLKAEIEAHNASIQEFMQKRQDYEKSTTKLRADERDVSSKREGVTRELTLLEERKIAMQQKYDGIIAKLWDEYELTRSGAAEMAKPLENSAESARRLTELRNKIRNLGSVNLAAVEEYKEVGERYEFLSVQVNDVEESKAKLNKLINDLTEEMRDIFQENFDKISTEFSKVFIDLFGGGRGELSLAETEDGDILQAGIDIHVEPPGKVIKNMSLLSGGEQAFVAIAIYFAILKVKPAPFVLLDEIEAALDDVNVVKFASYLRTLSDNTQFIAITHRRGTMEEADVLYGVTMQEEGVSKLLELNINEIESKLGMEA